MLNDLAKAMKALDGKKNMFEVKSVRTFGARFDCPGFNGRVHLRLEALQDLSAQFVFSPCLSSMLNCVSGVCSDLEIQQVVEQF